MKTIEEIALEYATLKLKQYNLDKSIDRIPVCDDFIAGVKFAQEWLVIDKDRDGFTTPKQMEEIVNNLPYLLKGENEREELYHELDNDVDKQYYTHWRPLNIK